MNITKKVSGGRVIIGISGRLDTTNYSVFEEEINAITKAGERFIIIDCEKMTYISSSGLRIFLMLLKKVKAADGRLVLCSLLPNINEVFEIAGFSSIFQIVKDLNAAESVFV